MFSHQMKTAPGRAWPQAKQLCNWDRAWRSWQLEAVCWLYFPLLVSKSCLEVGSLQGVNRCLLCWWVSPNQGGGERDEKMKRCEWDKEWGSWSRLECEVKSHSWFWAWDTGVRGHLFPSSLHHNDQLHGASNSLTGLASCNVNRLALASTSSK